MVIRKAARHFLEQVHFYIKKALGYTYWLHIGDLLTYCDGNMTAGQYFVASRILDIELIEKDKVPYWQNYLSEIIRGTPNDNLANVKFINLVNSLNCRGFNPNIEALSISDSPIVLNNGTHRIAWCVLHMPNAYLPFRQFKKDLKPWFPIDGGVFWKKLGLDEAALDILQKKYKEILLLNVRTWLTAYVRVEFYSDFIKIMQLYGEIRQSINISMNNIEYYVVSINLKKQKLYTSKDSIKSYYIDEIEKGMKKYHDWGRIAHTVTESVQMENYIESLTHISLVL